MCRVDDQLNGCHCHQQRPVFDELHEDLHCHSAAGFETFIELVLLTGSARGLRLNCCGVVFSSALLYHVYLG